MLWLAACWLLSFFADSRDLNTAALQTASADSLRAETLFQQKEYRQAAAAFMELLQRDSSDFNAMYKLGLAQLSIGELEPAIQTLSYALQHTKNRRHRVYFYRAFAYSNLGKLHEANSDYSLALVHDSSYTDALNNRGQIREKLGDTNGAMQDYNRLLQLDSTAAGTYYNMGRLLASLQRFDEALTYLSNSIRLDPDFFWAYLRRGDCLAFQENFEAARADFESATLLNPQNSEAFMKLGYCLVNLDRADEGCPKIIRAVDMGNPVAKAMMEEFCGESENDEREQ